MYLIVGLGNPGKRYAHTRHNIGFDSVTALSERLNLQLNRSSLNAEWGRGNVQGQSLIIAKPVTYMNRSGEAVQAVKNYFKIQENNMIVVVDDFSLPLGKLRFRAQGSAGGHNGLKSIINHLGHQSFQRLKLGIDPPPAPMAVTDYVLGHFRPDELEKVSALKQQAVEALLHWLQHGLPDAMRRFH